jgi:hypothetical protein
MTVHFVVWVLLHEQGIRLLKVTFMSLTSLFAGLFGLTWFMVDKPPF